MIYKNIGDYKVYCASCRRRNPWEQYFLTKSPNQYHCKCQYCSQAAFPIDKNMIKPLLLLWKKGFKTSFCCGGHLQKDSGLISYPYLGIKGNLESIPKEWKLDWTDGVSYLRTSLSMKLTHSNIERLNKHLIHWAKNVNSSLENYVESFSTPLKPSRYSPNIHIFLGSHVNKAKIEFRKHFVLKSGKLTLDILKKKKKVIIKNPLQLSEIDVSTLKLPSDYSLVVMFKPSQEQIKYHVPVYSFGWGSFNNYEINYKFFLSLLRLSPTVWTHDKFLVYQVPYNNSEVK